jgi:outer membrane protein assembly factor BamA
VPDGEFLLNKVNIRSDNKDIKQDELKEYIRQTPNAAVFGAWRMQLGLYNWAPKDTIKWLNRKLNKTFKKIGDPPVIYNPALTSLTVQQLQRLLENKGYINAKVQSKVKTNGKKAVVDYIINSNKPYKLGSYKINLKNVFLTQLAADTSKSLIKPGMLFDVDVFNAERERISKNFRQEGYFNFNKEFLSYTADSSLNSHAVNMTLELRDYLRRNADSLNKVIFRQFTVRKIIFQANTDANFTTLSENSAEMDTVVFKDFELISPKKRILKIDALVQNTYINPKSLYSDETVDKTYSALNALGAIKYVNITFKEVENNSLDCYIVVIPSKAVSLSTELEGTYTAGYWGVAGNVNIINRNVFKGAETLSLLARGAFEWQDGVWAEEYGGQIGLKFPRFMLPVGSYDFKRNIHANTEFTTSFGYQYRPGEFTTTNAGAGVNYSWNRGQFRHAFQLFDLSYVQFPKVEKAFRDRFLNPDNLIFNPYSYSDHLIWRMGYNGSYTTFNSYRPLQNYSVFRYSLETAGNGLNALSHLMSKPDSAGNYKLFNVRFAQYVKGEFNVTHHQIFNENNRFVYHLNVGLGVPYGNGEAIPFEKRFYSGGANSIRGWGESTLGPGTYQRIKSLPRDFNQVGDIKLDMNWEYRAKMFWIMEGALFLDAGNIWTIKDYDTQKGGTFHLDTFADQIAIAYGAGLRLDIKLFIFRFDVGVKLYDPAQASRLDKWRVSPKIDRDFALHFAIGYPF